MPAACPSCKNPLNIGPQHAGKAIKCPHCTSVFKVPASASTSGATATSTSKVAVASPPTSSQTASAPIVVTCSGCGKSLKAPPHAAGKAVRCQCGQPVKVPATQSPNPSTFASAKSSVAAPSQDLNFGLGGNSPLFNLSENEWKTAEVKKPVYTEETKPKKTINPYLVNAAEELKKGGKDRTEGAIEYLNSSRNFLFGLGGFKLAGDLVAYFIFRGLVSVIASSVDDEDTASMIYLFLNIYLGIGVFISVSFMVLGAMIRVIPLAASITALTMYVIIELGGFIVGVMILPFFYLSPRKLIERIIINIIIIGGLIQAINNANYYRYAKKLEQEEGR
jgi:hypothetical protein